MADREADIIALMVRAPDLEEAVDWLLRTKHNGALSESDKLWSRLTLGVSICEVRSTLAAPRRQRARELMRHAQTLQLPNGQKYLAQVSCIDTEEIPPAGDKPNQWRPLICLSVQTLKQAGQMTDWCRSRSKIEMSFHVL